MGIFVGCGLGGRSMLTVKQQNFIQYVLQKPGQHCGFLLARFMMVSLVLIWSSFNQKICAQENMREQEEEKLKIAGLLSENNFSGAVLVCQGQEVFLKKAYGWRDREKKIPNDVTSLFPIASITKTLVATAFLKLAQDEKISLDDPVQKYLHKNSLPQELTIRHLLSHTSGLLLYTDFNTPDAKRSEPLSKQNFYDLIGTLIPTSHDFNYNNGNYIILGHLVEHISQQNLEEHLTSVIFSPLGMTQTGFLSCTQKAETLVKGYSADGREALPIHQSWLGAGAGLYSSLEDLRLFIIGHLENKVISKEFTQKMLDPREGTPAYGLGWTLGTIFGHSFYCHEGGIDGFSTMLFLLPELGYSLILLSNEEVNIESLTHQIIQILVKKKN